MKTGLIDYLQHLLVDSVPFGRAHGEACINPLSIPTLNIAGTRMIARYILRVKEGGDLREGGLMGASRFWKFVVRAGELAGECTSATCSRVSVSQPPAPEWVYVSSPAHTTYSLPTVKLCTTILTPLPTHYSLLPLLQ